MPDYIFNTTALSNFAAARQLDLLKARYEGIAYTTVEVSTKLRKGVKAGYSYLEPTIQQIETINPGGWIRLLSPSSAAEYHLQSEFDQFLDAGEASCLALAALRGLTFVTDDLAARRLAAGRGVSLTGTLGILIALVRDGALSIEEANGILAAMIERGYRSPVDRLDGLI